MLFSTTTYATVLVSVLAIVGHLTPTVQAHSWADCIDWRFKNPKKTDWSDKGGRCFGYARRFPTGKAFGTLDSASPSRHYQQAGNPNMALPCSDGHHGKDVGSDETRADPPSRAYGGKWGTMTRTRVGNKLCIRWPAKNHAEKNEDDTEVQINFALHEGRDPTQQQLLAEQKEHPLELDYKSCGKASNTDKRPCGGCFEVPDRKPGTYLLQWRWMLNKGEWYTSCADVEITA
ncbi:hypothetical protein CPB97_009717 [Podila verticillata]|nr:hypothetical protein CPB97_009717 [Podila verticillata]